MKCHQTRKLFALFYDSEGDAEVQLHIGDHLAMCADCKAWFEAETRGQDAISNLLAHGDVDEAMWRRIEVAAIPQRAGNPRYRIVAAVAAVAALLVLAWGLNAWLPQGADARADLHLSRLAAVEHDRYVKGDWNVTLASNSVEEVERWLRANTGFAVRCPPVGTRGFQLQGGGVCRLNGEASAHIVGDVNGRRISIFVLDGSSLRAFPEMQSHVASAGQVHQRHEDPYEMVATRQHGHVVIVMGEGDADVLREILLGYGNLHNGQARRGTGGQFVPKLRLAIAHWLEMVSERQHG